MGVEWGGSDQRLRLRVLLFALVTALLLTLIWELELEPPEHTTCSPNLECVQR